MSDLNSVLVILFWVDLTISFLLVSYVVRMEDASHRKVLRRFTYARWVQTFAWGLFIAISAKPGLKSMLVGTAALLGGFYLETRSLFNFTAKPRWIAQTVLDALAILSIIVLLGSYVIIGRNEDRILQIALVAGLFILLPGPISMLRRSNSLLQTAIGLGYGILIFFMFLGVAQMSAPILPKFIPPPLIADLVKLLFVEVTMIGGMGIILLTKQEADRRILELALRDPLTGLHNRRFFMEEARDALAEAIRDKREVAMAFLDLDHFKKINDTHGHHFGDAVLRDFSALLKFHLRPSDRSCRYGGEEFLLLLPDADRDSASATLGRILELARASRFKSHPGFTYTVSVGVFVGAPESNSVDELQRLINLADSALYEAKRAGRDRIELSHGA